MRLQLSWPTSILVLTFAWLIHGRTANAADPSLHFLGRLPSAGGDLIHFSPDNSLILTAGGGHAQIWDARTLTAIGKPLMHDSEVTFARFTSGGKEAITGSDGGVRRWNTRSGEELSPFPKLNPMPERSSVSGDGRFLAGAVPSGRPEVEDVVVFDSATGARIANIHCNAHVEFVLLNSDGGKIVIVLERGLHERGFLIWDVRQVRAVCPEIRTAYDYRADVPLGLIPAAFDPDGKRVAVCDEISFRLYDSSSGRLVAQSPTRSDAILIHGVGFTADGQQVVVFDSIGISGWNSADATRTTPSVGAGFIYSHDVSRDGRRVALVATHYREDGTIDGQELSIWDWPTGRPLCVTRVNDATAMAFSTDAKIVAVASPKNRETLIWRLD